MAPEHLRASLTAVLPLYFLLMDEDVNSQIPAPATVSSTPTTTMDSSLLELCAKVNSLLLKLLPGLSVLRTQASTRRLHPCVPLCDRL